jgi:OFA family oxalate/formate antiporter-like MFS transporter
MATDNRWVIAAAGVLMQVALGAVYAWSVFRIPLSRTFGWTISEVTLTFTIAIFVLGLAAFAGGLWMRRTGPRTVALTAGVLYGLGVFLASLTDGRLWWLYSTYGVIAGVGLGLGYIVPVATLVKWFPDKRGCADYRADRDTPDRVSRSPPDIRHSRCRVLRHRHRRRIVHAESA